jgi:hypothetical protein
MFASELKPALAVSLIEGPNALLAACLPTLNRATRVLRYARVMLRAVATLGFTLLGCAGCAGDGDSEAEKPMETAADCEGRGEAFVAGVVVLRMTRTTVLGVEQLRARRGVYAGQTAHRCRKRRERERPSSTKADMTAWRSPCATVGALCHHGMRARAGLLCAALLLSAPVAHANGRFPLAQRFFEDAASQDRLMLSATFGLLITGDLEPTHCRRCVAVGSARRGDRHGRRRRVHPTKVIGDLGARRLAQGGSGTRLMLASSPAPLPAM